MAVGTLTPQKADQQGNTYANMGELTVTVTNVVPTSGANYAVGGVPITAQQLGHQVAVVWALATAITQAATVGPGEVSPIVQADGSIKLKCGLAAGTGDNGANADLSGTLVQVIAIGY